jgi:hypothetical protein
MKKVTLAALTAVSFLTGCASPEIISTRQPGDEGMTCAQLKDEIEKLDKSRRDLAAEKGCTGTNVAAALFFWPALIATHSNVNDAMRAVNERKDHLTKMYENKRCVSAN